VEGFSSLLPPFSQVTVTGLSPCTSQCNVAVSPFFTVTSRDGAAKYGDAVKSQQKGSREYPIRYEEREREREREEEIERH
jgi:hypothetical protein